jgi:transcriptional regulator with XRE-family HTH domain
MSHSNGSGQLDAREIAAALELLRGGMSQREVAERSGVTKNTISGLWARHGEPTRKQREATPGTLFTRCDALHTELDAVLAETVGVGRIGEAEAAARRLAWEARQ